MEKYRIAFCSTCATKRERAREPGFGSARAERRVTDGEEAAYPHPAQEGEAMD